MSLSVDTVDIKKKIDNCKTLQEVEVIRLEYLGKKGLISSEMKLLGKLPLDQKKIKGQELNKLKTFIEDAVNDHKNFIENKKLEDKLKNESIDVTLPHNEELIGKIHPISQTIFNIMEIFGNLNYFIRLCFFEKQHSSRRSSQIWQIQLCYSRIRYVVANEETSRGLRPYTHTL